MSTDHFPIGLEMDVSYLAFKVSLTLLSATQLRFQIKEGPFARTETVDIHVVPIGNSLLPSAGRNRRAPRSQMCRTMIAA